MYQQLVKQTPECEYFNICGGCNLQDIKYEDQLIQKQDNLIQLLKSHNITLDKTNWLPALYIKDNQFHYRQKARMGVKFVPKKGRVLVGFREKNNNKLTNMLYCKVLIKEVGDNLDIISIMLGSLSIYNKIAQIEVAKDEATNKPVLVLRNLAEFNQEDLNIITQFAQYYNYIIYLQPKGPSSVTKLYPNDAKLLAYFLPSFDLKIEFEPLDFTQINAKINQKMLLQAIELLKPNESDDILDLYSGVGNFSLSFAKFCKSLVGVEGSQNMQIRATSNAKLNNITNTKFYAQDLTQDLATLIKNNELSWIKHYNKLIIDPPRNGAENIVNNIELFNPEQILYVACGPESFARDADILINQKGYKLQKIGIMDMFAHTKHIETMGLFIKQ